MLLTKIGIVAYGVAIVYFSVATYGMYRDAQQEKFCDLVREHYNYHLDNQPRGILNYEGNQSTRSRF